ncbi:expressed unknown protein [Seminavis robusta]|uniref:Uncharacterized protein n=1 Tax=Seminavis robusta TaxID=568900 RepID=A0A9N8HMN6_9STRA|nr:expressed unknown protein [Seminavis robusta]|eukprot:Sro919_g220170.1 n/a (98) ;mRNA; f:41484-41777
MSGSHPHPNGNGQSGNGSNGLQFQPGVDDPNKLKRFLVGVVEQYNTLKQGGPLTNGGAGMNNGGMNNGNNNNGAMAAQLAALNAAQGAGGGMSHQIA